MDFKVTTAMGTWLMSRGLEKDSRRLEGMLKGSLNLLSLRNHR